MLSVCCLHICTFLLLLFLNVSMSETSTEKSSLLPISTSPASLLSTQQESSSPKESSTATTSPKGISPKYMSTPEFSSPVTLDSTSVKDMTSIQEIASTESNIVLSAKPEGSILKGSSVQQESTPSLLNTFSGPTTMPSESSKLTNSPTTLKYASTEAPAVSLPALPSTNDLELPTDASSLSDELPSSVEPLEGVSHKQTSMSPSNVTTIGLESRFKETPDIDEPLVDPDGITEPGMSPNEPVGQKSDQELSLSECLKKYKFGIFAHPADATKFYMCTKTKPREMTCPFGLQYSSSSFGCDRPSESPSPPPPALSLMDCLAKYKKGIFPNPTDCTKFYGCSKRGPIEMRCPKGLHFNPLSLVCDWPSRHCITPAAQTRDKILRTMKENKITPDIVDECPEKLAEVAFPSGSQMNLGNELTPTQTKDPPTIYWPAEKKTYYTLCMVDPDAPNPNKAQQWNHWMVGNIPGNNIRKGQTLTEYVGACPQKGTGLHRYTFLIFRQSSRINFNEPYVPRTTYMNRPGFSVRNFAQKYSLGSPIAGNFYRCKWDPYVPRIYNMMGYSPTVSAPMTYNRIMMPPQSNSYSKSWSYSFSFKT